MTGRVAVAIPAFEAAGSIAMVVRRAQAMGVEVVVVDDGSRDGTGDAAGVYLKAGDVMSGTVGNLGTLKTPVKA